MHFRSPSPQAEGSRKVSLFDYLVSTSSRFNIALATIVSAYRSRVCRQRLGGVGIRRRTPRPPRHTAATSAASFAGCDRLGPSPAVAGGDLRRRARPPRLPFARQSPGQLDERLVVQRHQRLQRRVRRDPPGDANVAARHVEREHARVAARPLPVGVDRAAVAVLALGRLPLLAVVNDPPHALRLRRHHRLAVHLGRQPAREGQRLVAHHLGREPRPRAAREQPIARVARRASRASPRPPADTSPTARGRAASA